VTPPDLPPAIPVVPVDPVLPPVVIVIPPVITTQSVLMIDGINSKTITTTDGIVSPYITSTTYPITYANAVSYTTYSLYCNKVVSYSDNTNYISNTEQTKTQLADKLAIDGAKRKQYSFSGVTETDIYNQPQTVFPYILRNNALPTVTYTTGQTQTQTWSDGRTYIKLM
jgi:hypothetical protein